MKVCISTKARQQNRYWKELRRTDTNQDITTNLKGIEAISLEKKRTPRKIRRKYNIEDLLKAKIAQNY